MTATLVGTPDPQQGATAAYIPPPRATWTTTTGSTSHGWTTVVVSGRL